MTLPPTSSYEQILDIVRSSTPAPSADDRDVVWCQDGGPVGIARDHDGQIEIFIAGPRLQIHSAVVERHVEHHTWHSSDRPVIEASRILLPRAGHFEPVAAFLCTELLRSGAAADTQLAFTRTELVMELALERLAMADRAILGLWGELTLIESLLRHAAPARHLEIASSWAGFGRSLRDLTLGTIGVEVKTTTRASSSHSIEGTHQIEPTRRDSGGTETSLYLASLGIERLTDETPDGTSLATTVDRILAHADRSSDGSRMAELIIDRIAQYGGDEALGYEHNTMHDRPPFTTPYALRFMRLYDMTDPAIHLIRSDDVRRAPLVDSGSVRYRINLPDQVSGDLNPIIGLNRSARHLLQQWNTTDGGER